MSEKLRISIVPPSFKKHQFMEDFYEAGTDGAETTDATQGHHSGASKASVDGYRTLTLLIYLCRNS
jgi:hypothetical protein